MKINRVWEMPNSITFQIKAIKEIIEKYSHGVVIDPFANSNKLATVTNDLDEQYETDYHMDATDFLSMFENGSIDVVLYDPPYSPRQVAECYKALGKTVNMQTTQASYWGKQKEQIGRIVKPGGYVITCSWNSGGIGKKYGFEIVEILLVAHGGWHNDTIVVVEKKKKVLTMDEYIKREAVLALVRPDAPEDEKAAVTIATAKKLVRNIVRRTPDADVVPVVRCKDCKYWQDNNDGYPHEECRWGHGETPDANDFCSYGERKEGADNG